MNKISIIIPTLNEAENITQLLQHLTNNASTTKVQEILVIDCGSDDDTQQLVLELAHTNNKIKLLHSERGRAKQMNIGAQNAQGEILYFLHADTFPPKAFDQLIINEVSKNNLAGCFRMKFNSKHWWLLLAGWLTKFNNKACRGGDQSLFITQKLFQKLNGFDEKFTVYEDQDFINKLYNIGQFTVIQKWITTSARRYESNGIWKLQYHFWTIYIKKFFGASADDLYAYYLKNIKD
ncbi:TIGR04283 family arsenosugar biosynthesis glycosyltransferase [Pseudofulvibacter geojedonensis]|uniref:TIGR04283 family arsenosugar biosynthesis glycosyltransferase n=1 Tax=Pseudofulvibacter geojedonensis TaxID=1123758 RepID=A0ABW3I1C8_9FLAO